MHFILIILTLVLAVIAIWFIVTYNSFVNLRNKVEEAFSTMDVYMKKRFDLIPSLVETVKGYAGHESSTLESLTRQRTNALTRNELLSAENGISKAIGKIMVVAESYPDLKANQNFLDLQNQLVIIEDEIACSRRYYNGSVRELNTKVQSFPSNLVASMFKIQEATMFEASVSERQVVEVTI